MTINGIIFLCMCLLGCLGFVGTSAVAVTDKILKGLFLFIAFEGIALFILKNVMAIK